VLKENRVPGIHGIFHAASPLNLDLATWESVVVPAVRGTEVLLNSALAHAGDQLEAVIVTSSGFALINNDAPAGYVMTEPDSNTWAVEAAKSLKAHQLSPRERGGIFYSASKAAANLAVWKFREEHKVWCRYCLAVQYL
jgi:nucleoside-diphosphate-sugar epimerase